jgi:two-component system, chemotaxis family, protein-glutamate methylesterase/glutaminase
LDLNDDIVKRWHNSEILLLGGSAGSFKIMFQITKELNPWVNKAVVIIIHRSKNFLSEIETLFADNSRLILREIADKDPIKKNTIYIAPANYHTLIESKRNFALDVSDQIWFSKPAIDVTFETAADVYKERCTAVLFSGANQDGAQGLLKLKKAGALTIIQDPEEAEMSEMPQMAVNINAGSYILKTAQIFELFGK